MKKWYVIGLVISTLFMGIHFIVIRDQLTVTWVLRNVAVTYVTAHLYLGYSFLSLQLARGWNFRGTRPRVVEAWILILALSGFGIYLYFMNVGHMDVNDPFQNSDFVHSASMFFIGGVIEQIRENRKEQGLIPNRSE